MFFMEDLEEVFSYKIFRSSHERSRDHRSPVSFPIEDHEEKNY